MVGAVATSQLEGGREQDLARASRKVSRSPGALILGGVDALSRGFIGLVDSGIPEKIRSGDQDTLRRARMILGFTLFLIALGVETALFFRWILPASASEFVLYALVGALFLTLLIPVAFRLFDTLTVGANLVLASAYVVAVAIFCVIGGINAPLIHWLALMPMLAALMGARTSVWVWTTISVATVTGFILADAGGVTFTDAVGFSELEGSALWFQRFVNLVSWLGLLLAIALLFEAQRNKQTSQLAAKNAELQAQVSQRNVAEQRSQYLAYYDDLTGVPNRRLFLEQLEVAIRQTARLDRMLGLLFLDLDRFKEVNDLHGHARGDKLLQQFSQRLLGCLRESDRVSHPAAEELGNIARLGGDEFTVLLSGIHGHQDAARVAERILKCMADPFVIDDLELHIGTSIGIAIYSEGPMDADELLRNSDLAMYQAKSAGKNNYKFHEASMNADIVLRNTMTDSLRSALEKEELSLHFQPIVKARTRATTGVEALLRWERPGRGMVPTEKLIELAEESGLIVPLGNWVIREACRRYQQWRKAGIAPNRIAVNVSAEQFRRGGVVDTVRAALGEFAMEARCLEIEITEGAMMVDEERTLRALRGLKSMGVMIALDDFGTGYSSLSYVHRFPVDAVKVDRSFVAGVEDEQSSRAITMAVIALAHQLGLRVVAEGVENIFQRDFLVEKGCDELQGFLYSTPVPAEGIVEYLHGEQEGRKDLAG